MRASVALTARIAECGRLCNRMCGRLCRCMRAGVADNAVCACLCGRLSAYIHAGVADTACVHCAQENYNLTQQQESYRSRCTSPWRNEAHTPFSPPPPQASICPTGNAQDTKAVDTTPHLQKLVQSRPPRHPSALYPVHSTFKDLCFLTLHASPSVCHLKLLAPKPHIIVAVHNASRVRFVGPNPYAAPALGYGNRELLPPVCTIHRSLPSTTLLSKGATVLHNPAHIHCYFSPPQHCLEASGDFSPGLLPYTDGYVWYMRSTILN